MSARIIMLGNSGAGKTTNMVAAYGRMYDIFRGDGILRRGIRIPEHPDFLEAYHKYIAGEKDFAGTVKSDYRSLSIGYRGLLGTRSVIRFDMVDTPGGHAVGADLTQRNALSNEIARADHILLFLPCDELIPYSETDRKKFCVNLDRLLDLINTRVAGDSPPVRLTLVFSKSDRISDCCRREIEMMFKDVVGNNNGRLRISSHFVSSNARNFESVEIPLISVLAHILYNEAMSGKGSRFPVGEERATKQAAIRLCEYMCKMEGENWRPMLDALLR